MCAMMPIFLQRSNGTCLGTIPSVSCYAVLRPLSTLRRGPPATAIPFAVTWVPRSPALFCWRLGGTKKLPPVVRKRLIGFRHAVYVFFLLNCGTASIGGVKQLVGQLVDHALLTTRTAVCQNPANRQRR